MKPKRIKRATRITTLTIALALFLSQMMAGHLYASDDDPFTQKSRADTELFGSGYLASTAAKSDAVMRQDISKRSSLEANATDTNQRTADKVTEAASNKVAPELKKKVSSGDRGGTSVAMGDIREGVMTSDEINKFVVAFRMHIGQAADNTASYDDAFDIDCNGGVNLGDYLKMRALVGESVNSETYEKAMNKISSVYKAKMGLKQGDKGYFESFDINGNGTIDTADYGKVWNTYTAGRSNIPVSVRVAHDSVIPTASAATPTLQRSTMKDKDADKNKVFDRSSDTDKSKTTDVTADPLTTTKLSDSGLAGKTEGAGEGETIVEQSPPQEQIAPTLYDLEGALVDLKGRFTDPTAEEQAMLDSIDAFYKAADQTITGDATDIEESVQVLTAIFTTENLNGIHATDISAVKGIFGTLNLQKDKIISEYLATIEPYYDELKKELIVKILALKARGVLGEELTTDAVIRLPRKKVDEIIKEIRMSGSDDPDLKAILIKEEMLSKAYVAPHARELETRMRSLIKECASSLKQLLYERSKK